MMSMRLPCNSLGEILNQIEVPEVFGIFWDGCDGSELGTKGAALAP